MVKQLNVRIEDDEYEDLKEVKGERTWKEAIRQEFGVGDE